MFRFILPNFQFKIERWKWNKEYRVYVSNQGHFKDEYKNNLPIKINSTGYGAIYTRYGWKLTHRLVMLTWVPIPNAEEMTIDHLDQNKRNNTINNLEWVTKEENFKRACENFVNDDCKKESFKITNGIEIFESFGDAAQWLKKEQRVRKKAAGIATRLKNIMKDSPTREYCGYTWDFVK